MGDSRHILRGDATEVAEACERGGLDEARDSAGLLLADLDALPARYEAALDWHEIRIPRPYRDVETSAWEARVIQGELGA
ncbi:DUF6959 family protein [Streptomyces atratus]|uniref:DUF6959 family protein n=1 Tax=Streptomyces atratus TaxID=1893 RepID=UPI0037D9A36B